MVQNRREIDSLGDVGVEGRIILKIILKKHYEMRIQIHPVQDNRLLTTDCCLNWCERYAVEEKCIRISGNMAGVGTCNACDAVAR